MEIPIEQIHQLLRSRQRPADAPRPSIREMREGMLASTAAMQPVDGSEISEIELGGVRGLKIVAPKSEPGRTLLYFHGGGYVIGSPETHCGLVSHIADAMGAVAYSMDYRLAPEHPFPAAIEDGVAAYQGLLEGGQEPGSVIIAGDSAGGGTTLATTLKARASDLPMPAGLALLSPWVNLENTGWSYTARAERDPMISKDNIDWMAQLYLNGAPPTHEYASPVYADLAGLPPLLIQVGPDEVLLSDSILLAERAGAAHVSVTLEVWPEMFHVFQALYPFLSAARQAIHRIGDWGAGQLA